MPKSSRITFQSYANLKVLPGGDPEREFEEGSFQFLLFDPQRRNTAGLSSAHPGMLLGCHPWKMRGITGGEEASGPHAGLPVSPDTAPASTSRIQHPL